MVAQAAALICFDWRCFLFFNFNNSVLSNLLGVVSGFYLATFTLLGGGVSEFLFIVVGLMTALKFLFSAERSRTLVLSEVGYVVSLFFMSGWFFFSAFWHEGSAKDFELPSKILLAAVLAVPILKVGINVRWVSYGVGFGTLILFLFYLHNYDGGLERFSPLMHPTKWAHSLSFIALIALSLIVISKRRFWVVINVLCFCFLFYLIILSGTRGAVLTLIGGSLLVFAVSFKLTSFKSVFFTSLLVMFLLLVASQSSVVTERYRASVSDVLNMQSVDFSGSMGQRLMMWSAGLYLWGEDPFLGSGFNFSEVILQYNADTPEQRQTIREIAMNHENFHSIIFDVVTKRGTVGLLALFGVIICGLWSRSRERFLLVIPPFLGFVFAGISDSVLELSITSTFFLFGGLILKSAASTMR